MQSPLPLRSFEHSGPVTLYACPHVWLCCLVPRALGESKFTCISVMQLHVWMCPSCTDEAWNAETCMSADGPNMVSALCTVVVVQTGFKLSIIMQTGFKFHANRTRNQLA